MSNQYIQNSTGYLKDFKISGFTLIKNAVKFQYPIVESVNSLLPLVDEYVINVGISKDGTKEMLNKVFGNNVKVKMFDSEWEDASKGTAFFSNQTNQSMNQCDISSDWLFYLQADEAVLEKNHIKIIEAIKEAKNNGKTSIVFDYLHFEKNFKKLRKTYNEGFDCYEDEVRIFKNDGTVQSWGDGQGFCHKNRYGLSLRKIEEELYLSHIPIYHYGYVKSAKAMLEKKKALNEYYFNESHFSEEQKQKELDKIKNAKDEYQFSYQLNDFNGSHPESMQERIKKFNEENPELLED